MSLVAVVLMWLQRECPIQYLNPSGSPLDPQSKDWPWHGAMVSIDTTKPWPQQAMEQKPGGEPPLRLVLVGCQTGWSRGIY